MEKWRRGERFYARLNIENALAGVKKTRRVPLVDKDAAAVRREIKPSGLSSLEVNMIGTEILDAAQESARTGRRVDLK